MMMMMMMMIYSTMAIYSKEKRSIGCKRERKIKRQNALNIYIYNNKYHNQFAQAGFFFQFFNSERFLLRCNQQ
jgi:hypothetical protein